MPVPIEQLLPFLAGAILVTIVPGADMALVMRQVFIGGTALAQRTIFGNLTGLVVHASRSPPGSRRCSSPPPRRTPWSSSPGRRTSSTSACSRSSRRDARHVGRPMAPDAAEGRAVDANRLPAGPDEHGAEPEAGAVLPDVPAPVRRRGSPGAAADRVPRRAAHRHRADLDDRCTPTSSIGRTGRSPDATSDAGSRAQPASSSSPWGSGSRWSAADPDGSPNRPGGAASTAPRHTPVMPDSGSWANDVSPEELAHPESLAVHRCPGTRGRRPVVADAPAAHHRARPHDHPRRRRGARRLDGHAHRRPGARRARAVRPRLLGVPRRVAARHRRRRHAHRSPRRRVPVPPRARRCSRSGSPSPARPSRCRC